jgi:hypothetical protein
LAFSDWLIAISTNEGLVGYRLDLTCFEAELIYFENSEATLRFVENCQIPASLINRIDDLLGGTGCCDISQLHKIR